jgi:hypothetical protein
MEELKKQIIDTIIKDGKNIEELVGILKWSLKNAQELLDTKVNGLEQAKEITSLEYADLENPIFKMQTKLDKECKYWMVFENNGMMYKIHNSIYEF